ncbi:ABC transporter permease [Polaribacter sp.]|jgi:putative ABC transport system permease protein|uniref:ABC transporter permease n=1 Tax=Polaribacter sp. TaxID=1920175 RepID=UPI003EE9A5C1
MYKIWFKIFFRNQQKNCLHTLINILGLTLGFAGLLIVLLYFNDEQSYNVNNRYKEEVFRVLHRTPNGAVGSHTTSVEGAKYKDGIPEITAYYLSPSWYNSALVQVNGREQFSEDILEGSPNFFDFFPFKIISGDENTFKEARNHVAISEKQANIFFGKESAIGKTLAFSDRTFIVTTVYKIIGKHYYMPKIIVQYKKQPEGQDWNNLGFSLFIKTTKEADLAILEKKVLAVWYQNYVLPFSDKEGITPEEFIEERGVTPLFESIKDIRLKTIAGNAGPEGKGNYQLILIMLSLSILLIVISCVNFINLSIASAAQRAKEVGVKKTLGLSRLRLTTQYVLEIVLQGIISFLFSLLLVELILPSFNDFMDKDIAILDIDLLLKIALLAILVSIFIGSIPAVYISKFKAVEVLKGNVSRSKKGVFGRNMMLGIQFLISGFFLISAIVINNQVTYMMHKDLGFKGDQVTMIAMNKAKDRNKNYLLAKKELIKHPNIESVTSNLSIIGGGMGMGTSVEYKDISETASLDAVDYNYFEVLDIQILKGRAFEEEIASDTIGNILINETLAKTLNIYDDPIGKDIKTRFGSGQVIGMVQDYNVDGLDREIRPTVFMHWNSIDFLKSMLTTIQVKVKPNNVLETLGFLEEYWQENVEQGYPFNSSFVNKRFARTYKKYQNQQILFFILTSVVILISLLGLFALATLTIQQRLKEVAIRKTLGASIKEIMFQLMKSFLKIVLISSVILIPIAYYFMQNWLDNFVYKIDMPILPFIITPILLIVLVFMVVGLKAYNATKIDLIKYLKFE